MSDVIFDDEASAYKTPLPQETVPRSGISGLLYRILPGSVTLKRTLLIGIIVALFAASFIVLLVGNSGSQPDRESFEERANPRRT